MSKNNIEKDPMPGKGDLSEKEKLIKLASETGEEEFDLELGSTLLQYDEWKKENDDSTNVSNEMNEIKTDVNATTRNKNERNEDENEKEQDESVHDKFALQNNEKENELLLSQQN